MRSLIRKRAALIFFNNFRSRSRVRSSSPNSDSCVARSFGSVKMADCLMRNTDSNFSRRELLYSVLHACVDERGLCADTLGCFVHSLSILDFGGPRASQNSIFVSIRRGPSQASQAGKSWKSGLGILLQGMRWGGGLPANRPESADFALNFR